MYASGFVQVLFPLLSHRRLQSAGFDVICVSPRKKATARFLNGRQQGHRHGMQQEDDRVESVLLALHNATD